MASRTSQQIEGKEVIDQDGTRIGKVAQAINRTGEDAEWARVKLGRFGVRSAWIPIIEADMSGDALRVPYGRGQVENAHEIASDNDLSLDQQSRLRQHFGTSGAQGDYDPETQNYRDPGARDNDQATVVPTAIPADRTDARDDDRVMDSETVVDRDRDLNRDRAPARERTVMPDAQTVRADQREAFGGVNWGSAFFGWLVATGLAVIVLSIIAAAGASLGLTEANVNESLSIGGAVALLVTLAIAYYAGGYVAGRMSRFDGARQGAAVWVWGLSLMLLAAAAGWIVGSEYNVLQELNLPRIPVDEGSLATGAAITLAATALLTLLASIAGGKVGERYHERVDESTFPNRSRR